MAGVSVSNLVLFTAALTVAAGVAGTLTVTTMDVSDAVDRRGTALSDRIDADVRVISDAGSDAVYDGANETITLLVKNTGDRTLRADPAAVDVLVDGQYVPVEALNVTVVSGTAWRDGSVARLRVDRELTGGTHRVTVVAGGDRERFEFFV
jgi:flagellar protein FlaG